MMAASTAKGMRSMGNAEQRLFDDRMGSGRGLRMPMDRRADNLPLGEVTINNPSHILGPDGMPIQRRVTQPIMGSDGGCNVPPKYVNDSVSGALDNAQSEGGLFQRWREHRKWLKKEYPWVRGSELKNIPMIPIHYCLYRVFDGITNSLNPGGGFFTSIVRGMTDTLRYTHEQQYRGLPFKIFPRVKIMTVFSNGSTDIERVYTLEKDGWEVPIQFQKLGTNLPDNGTLTAAANFVDTHGISPYNKVVRNADTLLDRDFIKFGADKFMRGDYSRYFHEQPQKIHRALFKDDSYGIFSYGERDMVTEAAVNTALPAPLSGRVKVYKEPGKTNGFWYRLGNLMGDTTPSSWKTWWYWAVGDVIYDLTDIGFGPAEALLRKLGLPSEGLRYLMEAEYKVAAGTRRGLMHPRGTNFTFEIPAYAHNLEAATRAASDAGYN